jgi:hypothetical protein
MHRHSTAARELAFIDRSVDDLETLLRHLRPEVDAIVLDPQKPALAQIVESLKGRADASLDAVHVIAHGKPGEIAFSSGALTLPALAAHAAELRAIGATLRRGELRLWTCETARGPEGAKFIAALALATGACVAGATGRIGSAKKGGRWTLDARAESALARAPLTREGAEKYEGVMATLTSTGGTDTLIGTTGTDLFNVDNGTIQAGDTLNGSGGTDTRTYLKIA